MHPSDLKLISRWLPRLEDRSDEVKVTAIEFLSAIALRNADQRNLIAPRLLHLAKSVNEWAVLTNGFLTNASTIAEFDATWAEDFFDAYFVIAQKNIEIASGRAFERMLVLLANGSISPSNPLVVSANDLAREQLKAGGNEYIRNALFALTDWYEDHATESNISEDSYLPSPRSDFEWPSTNAPDSTLRLGNEIFPIEVGVLRTIGYTVGTTNGQQVGFRRRLLSGFFTTRPKLPTEHPQSTEWGEPNSAARLLKLANTIAAHARNAKRRKHRPDAAISDWESDLAFLKSEYYDDHFRFQWPSTESF